MDARMDEQWKDGNVCVHRFNQGAVKYSCSGKLLHK